MPDRYTLVALGLAGALVFGLPLFGSLADPERGYAEAYGQLGRQLRSLVHQMGEPAAEPTASAPSPTRPVPAPTATAPRPSATPVEIKPTLTPSRPAVAVVFLGDSHFELWDVSRFFSSLVVVNRGVYGETSGEIRGRFESQVAAVSPEWVVIVAGANDIYAGTDPRDTQANIGAMVSRARELGVRPVLATVPPAREGPDVPPNWVTPYNDRVRELNAWLKAQGPALGAAVADFHQALVDEAGELRAVYASPDGLHLSERGYARIAEVLWPLLREGATR